MSKKQEWTVRVVNVFDRTIGRGLYHELPSLWVEQLRYLGHLKVLAEHDDRSVLEFCAPKGSDSKVWSDMNAERMRSFGINAASAPKWDSATDRPLTENGSSFGTTRQWA